MESETPTPPKATRALFDPDQLRKNVLSRTLDAFQKKLNTLESKNYKLRVTNFTYGDKEKTFSLNDQKNAILNRTDITVPLKANFSLIDNRTGQEVANKTTVVAHVPYITPRQTTIFNGSEYFNQLQLRLKPGVYTRIKDSGEAEAHINVEPGSGLGARIIFLPEKGTFVYRVQNTMIPLYGILKDLGVPDEHMKKAWGDEIFNKNKSTYTSNECEKLHDKIFNKTFD